MGLDGIRVAEPAVSSESNGLLSMVVSGTSPRAQFRCSFGVSVGTSTTAGSRVHLVDGANCAAPCRRPFPKWLLDINGRLLLLASSPVKLLSHHFVCSQAMALAKLQRFTTPYLNRVSRGRKSS